MARPVVALLSDFGTRDHYVGTMKAVVLGVCPDAALVDIGHEIPAHDVLAGALELAAAYRYFPPGTVFLAVVDPGVGSARRAIAAEAGDFRFVAPDNGLLTAVLRETPARAIVELTDAAYARPTVSRTFEGRDRFAPAAGWLARGLGLESLGPRLPECRMLDLPEPSITDAAIAGEVVRADRFGNLITNIDRRTLERFAQGGALAITAGPHQVSRLVATYDEAPDGGPVALVGSTDHLEIAVREASAAERLALGRGAPVVVRRA